MHKVERKIFPVCLLLENKKCLVVGGGKVASRKIQLLLDAGAQVTVIAPLISEEIRLHTNNNTITYIDRQFIDTDLDQFSVVYCATNDKQINNHVLELCRKQKILCCSIDSGWVDGDFLTPAIIRQEDLIVSVSTGGKACRRSRLIKSSLSRHLSCIDNSTLAVIGTSYVELPTDRRESIHCTGDDYQLKGSMISQIRGIHEFVLLNTCNRIELYFTGTVTSELKHLLKRILQMDSLTENEFYFKEGIEAFEHGVALCAGLHSQLPGENHITAQMKEAVSLCTKKSWSSTIMQEWFSSTLYLAREVRQATSMLLRNEDYEDVALKYILSERKQPSLTITIIGTGVVGTTVLHKVLQAIPHSNVNWIYHNSAPAVPSQFTRKVSVSGFTTLYEKIGNTDIIISAVRSDSPVIVNSKLLSIKADALLIDLSMPRSIDTSITEHYSSLTLVDLDYLKKWYRIEQVDRENLFAISNKTVCENRDYYDKLITSITGRHSQ